MVAERMGCKMLLPLRDGRGWLQVFPSGGDRRVRRCDICYQIKDECHFPPSRATGRPSGICQKCSRKYVRDICWTKWHKNKWFNDSLYGHLHAVVRGARGGARSRGLYYRIEPINVFDLYFAQDGKCALSGIEMTHQKGDKNSGRRGGRRVPTNVSIDRMDNEKGYIPGNIHLVASVVNIMKGTMTTDELIFWCGHIILTRADQDDAAAAKS